MAKPKKAVTKKPELSTLESLVKTWSAIQDKIDKENKILKDLNAEYDAQERKVFELMQAQGLTNCGTGKATAYIANKTYVSLEPDTGFDKFISYVLKNNATDLLHRRVNQKAYLDRLNNGEKVPGVSKVEIPECHLRRKS